MMKNAKRLAARSDVTTLVVGDHVRVITGEEGVVDYFIANQTKSVHVLFRPRFGGVYFPFECEKYAPGADEFERDANSHYSCAQIAEITAKVRA